MKGTRASPDEWCMHFQLSLKDGALHWHRQLLKKTKRTWSLLSSLFIRYYCAQYNQTAETRYYSAKREDKEHLCDYLNRLNGYARNAGIQFDKGGRRARDHVKRFLETCGDRGLERRLCHVKVYDIHELEEMIIEILKVDDRESAKGSSQSRSRSHDTSRSKRSDHPRDSYSRSDRRDRDFGRRRDDSRNIPRVTFAEGAKAFEAQKTYTSNQDDRHDIYDDYNDYDNHDGWNADESRYTDEKREEYDDSVDEDDFVAAANEVERRNEAGGTYARLNVRVPKTEQSRGFNRANRFQRQNNTDRFPRRQYGPCGACGDMSHSTHFCRRRCKFCKQVHEPGRCEVFQELTKLVRTKVDKKDIAPELQTLLFGEPLNWLAEPAIEAVCVYAFVGECEWPVKSQLNCMISTENGLEGSNTLGGEDIMRSTEDSLEVKAEGIVSDYYPVREWGGGRLKRSIGEGGCGHWLKEQSMTRELEYFWTQEQM
ncbi:hypothetical protein PHMEG_00029205 [Phytophthora megakarya]|uniref:Retrotransposon gag domain-containing protein n=2 Tax=Phytophthora megakarya TaxID=4795 RepID=A0A225V485_9STRA|nr:hypothetical protein PHMEG_00029205 [Phytophthora megakarya]